MYNENCGIIVIPKFPFMSHKLCFVFCLNKHLSLTLVLFFFISSLRRSSVAVPKYFFFLNQKLSSLDSLTRSTDDKVNGCVATAKLIMLGMKEGGKPHPARRPEKEAMRQTVSDTGRFFFFSCSGVASFPHFRFATAVPRLNSPALSLKTRLTFPKVSLSSPALITEASF